MNKLEKVPLLEINGLDDFHFGNTKWQFPFSDSHSLFHINRLEEMHGKLIFPLPPHRKTVFDLLFLTKGSSIRSKGLSRYTFGENQFFFLPANQITSHEFISEDAEGYFLHFDDEIFRTLSLSHVLKDFPFLDFLANPIVSVPLKTQKTFLNIFERLEELYKDLRKPELGLVGYYLLVLLTEVKKFAIIEKNANKNSAAIVTHQYKNLLTQYIHQKQKVSDYADLLSVTANHLNKCIKQTTNKTAQDLLNEMLIMEAKSLLKYSDLHISEIAVKLCNQTSSNFARFFKTHTGMTPKEYQD
jgi:AraC family transcriptional regulator, transcriptional activator of pobA